jgi:hypothetical protein
MEEATETLSTRVLRLTEIFPEESEERLLFALSSCDGDWSRAAEIVLDGTLQLLLYESATTTTSPPPPQQQPNGKGKAKEVEEDKKESILEDLSPRTRAAIAAIQQNDAESDDDGGNSGEEDPIANQIAEEILNLRINHQTQPSLPTTATTTTSSSMQPITVLDRFGLAGERGKKKKEEEEEEEEVWVLAPREEDQAQSLWTSMGNDALFSVFEFLPCEDLVACMLVSRTWFHVAADKVLWRRLYIRRWMIHPFSTTTTTTTTTTGETREGGTEEGLVVGGWKAFVLKSNEHFLRTKNFTFIKGLHIWKNFGKEKVCLLHSPSLVSSSTFNLTNKPLLSSSLLILSAGIEVSL